MRDFAVSRDRKVLDGLDTFRYLRSDQIADLYFTTIKDSGQRCKKTSERMRKMFVAGYVKRFRLGCEPFIYTVAGSQGSDKIQHYLAIADVMIALQRIKPAGSILNFDIEIKFDDLICDLWVSYRNEFRREQKEYFIEVELNSTGDVLQKIERYRRLLRARKHESKADDELYVLCRKNAVQRKIEGAEFDFPVKALPLMEFEKGWQW